MATVPAKKPQAARSIAVVAKRTSNSGIPFLTESNLALRVTERAA
jgi:hypothetical protein